MGGAEVFTHEIAKRWVKAGHEVTLFTSEFLGCTQDEVLDGVHVVRSGGKYSVYSRAKEYYRMYFSKEGFDLIIDEVNTRPFLTPKFVKKGEKIVGLIHQLAREYWFYETPFPISYIGYHFFEDRWLRNYIGVPMVTVSESTRKDLLNLGFEQVFVVSEGLNFKPLDNVPKKESYPVAIYVGRLTQAKRPDHVVKAFRTIRNFIPKAELWIIGDGSFKGDLMRMANESVRFFSGLSDDKRRELIARAWVLVNPSVREGFGLNIVEANALGVPCVAYDVAGLRDAVINNETGLLVESGNIKALEERICRVLTDYALRGRLSENALSYSRSFSWDKVAEEFMEIIITADRV
jgi:glycosyltransferase involved in cell wall biosynthesis